MAQHPRVMIYKRDHVGDPDKSGCFGINDCMGTFRDRSVDAVIGVGGIGGNPQSAGIERKINWIGIGPHKVYDSEEATLGGNERTRRGPTVTFDHFVLYDAHGPYFEKFAPNLARRMYRENIRSVIDKLNEAEQMEVELVLALAENAPPSPCRTSSGDMTPHRRPSCQDAQEHQTSRKSPGIC